MLCRCITFKSKRTNVALYSSNLVLDSSILNRSRQSGALLLLSSWSRISIKDSKLLVTPEREQFIELRVNLLLVILDNLVLSTSAI